MNLLAQRDIANPILETEIRNETGVGFFNRSIPFLVTASLVVGFVVFFFMFAIGAIKWITAGGDQKAIESARSTLGTAFIGLLVLTAVFVIVNFISYFFGTSLLVFNIQRFIVGN